MEDLAQLVSNLLQTNERMQNELNTTNTELVNTKTMLTSLNDNAHSRIVSLEAEVLKLTNNTIELERKLTIKTANMRDSEMKIIMNTNLLKGQEFAKFTNKDSYELWVDGIKNDLYSQLPDARLFIEFAEEPPAEHTTSDSTGNKHLTISNIQNAIALDINGPFKCDAKVAEQIDFKIYSLLNNFTREHPVAHGKIKMNNATTKLGTLAWYNLRNFFHEETAEYKTTCMKNALNVTKCATMDQLAVRLDAWLYAVAKIAKLDPAKALPEDY